MKQCKRKMETFRLFISIYALNTFKFSHQTSSEFQLLNTAHDNNNTTLLTTHQCLPIYVNINLDFLIVCASMCMNPKSAEWEILHEEITENEELLIDELQCLFFEFYEDGRCMVCVTVPGVNSPEQTIGVAPFVGILQFPAIYGAGKLSNGATGRCIQPNGPANVGAALVLRAACDDDHRWTWYKNGTIKHKLSGLCWSPENGNPNPSFNVRVTLVDCATAAHFKRTDVKVIQHSNGFCVHPRNTYALENRELVFWSGSGAAPKLQYNFI